jgi:hypothetical protein
MCFASDCIKSSLVVIISVTCFAWRAAARLIRTFTAFKRGHANSPFTPFRRRSNDVQTRIQGHFRHDKEKKSHHTKHRKHSKHKKHKKHKKPKHKKRRQRRGPTDLPSAPTLEQNQYWLLHGRIANLEAQGLQQQGGPVAPAEKKMSRKDHTLIVLSPDPEYNLLS